MCLPTRKVLDEICDYRATRMPVEIRTEFSVVDGLRELRRGELGKNSLVPICTKFISTAVSSPTITGGSLSGDNAYIKVKRLFAGCALYRSTSKPNGIFAQHRAVPCAMPK